MNALPDYMIIEFFNWIKTNENTHLNIGFVRECVMRDKHTYSAMDDLIPYAKEFIYQKHLDIEAWELVESMRAYLTYRYADENSIKRVENSLWQEPLNKKTNSKIKINGNALIHMMTAVPDSLHTEIEFLEWLLKQKLNADDVYKMPMCVFEQLAKDFLIETNGIINNDLLVCLFHEFKDENPKRFLDRLKSLISMNTFREDAEKYKSIAELFGRYSDPCIMKCFFLPLAQDKMFENFINNSWYDLNALSRNYLDIYYSVKELSASGYDIKNKFHSLEVAEDALPCLVLWADSLENAKYVELRDLEYKEIFRLMQSIVQYIKTGDTFDVVYSKATIKAEDLRKEHTNIMTNERSTTIMNQTNYNINNSSLVGSQIGTTNSQLNFNQSNFSDEISQAIFEIKGIAELSEENKKLIIDLLQQIDAAVKSDNKNAQVEAKFTLKGILKGIGNTSVKVISVLSGLANLAKFFGFQTP